MLAIIWNEVENAILLMDAGVDINIKNKVTLEYTQIVSFANNQKNI